MKIHLFTLLFPLLTMAAALPAGYAHAGLPDQLALNYSLRYGSLTVGASTRTLKRQEDGSYRHALHTVPLGMARMFTSAEWYEEGHFRVVDNQVQPLNYLKYRVGAKKPRRNSAQFDWDKGRIHYSTGMDLPLPAGSQDQGSLLFSLMLNPPTGTKTHTLPLSSAKKLARYDYRYLRSEEVETPAGRFNAIVIQWVPHPPSDETERVTAWLASDKNHIPVKLVTQENNKTATMLLQSLKGL